jgi:hypothetical protein
LNKTHTTSNASFDWDLYWYDVRNGVSTTKQIKKLQNGDYMTVINPAIKSNDRFDNVSYEKDKAMYGKAIAEIWKKNGSYRR